MALDPAQLPDDVATLKAMLAAANVRALDLDAQIANLKLTIAKMRRDTFGSSSEHGAKLIDQMELQLADLVEAVTEGKVTAAIDGPIKDASEQKPARRPLPAQLPRERIVHAAYAALRSAGVTVDFVAPGAPLDGYRLVMVPSLYMVSDHAVSMIESFVADGGAAVVTFFSGIVDETDSIRLDPTGAVPPGAFSSLIGAWTEQFFPLAPNETIALTDGSAPTIWSERVRVTTADVIARFESGPVAGDPAITRNSFGHGTAWYVATALDELGLAAFIAGALDAAGVTYRPTEPGLEIIVRSNDRSRFTFFINHNDRPVSVDADGAELVTGVVVLGRLEVPAGSVRIVRHQSAVREAA